VILCDRNIEALGDSLISPFDPYRLSGASYDVAIANEIMIEDRLEGFRKITLNEDGIEINPKEFFLASISEWINIPSNMACEFRLKSSRAREGWQHNLAVWADPGYAGRLTLELSNMLRFETLTIRPGLLIGQLIFHTLTGECDRPYSKKGRYNQAETVECSKG